MMSEESGPHRGIKLLAVVVGASIIGATLGALVVPGSSLGEVLVAIPLILIALAGSYGIAKNEPIIGALAGLGLLLVLEALAELAIILLIGAFGFIVTATLAALETYVKRRRS